ncbi:MAG: IS110 family transposase [bacterium]
MSHPLFVGIDIDTKKNTVCFLNSEGLKVIPSYAFSNNLSGAQSLLTYILNLMKTYSFDSVSIGGEATSVYSFHILNFFFFSKELSPFHPQIYRFNPRLIAGFKKAYPDLPKTDDIDAFVIADRLRFGRLPANIKFNLQYLPLQKLTRARFHLVQTISREKNFFLTNLFLKFSNYITDTPFSDIFGATSSTVITQLSPEEIASMPIENLLSLLIEKSRNRFQQPLLIAQELKKISKLAYPLPPQMKEAVDIVLLALLQNIRTMEAQLKKIDQSIAKEISGIQHTLLSIQGIGPVFAAGIIAEIGDISCFKNQAALAKYIGLVWNKHQSGDFEAEDTYMSKHGNKYLRYYFIQAANTLHLHNSDFKKYYSRKYSESTKHHHKRALVLCARKLVRVIYCLLRSKKRYELPKTANS